MRKKVNLRQKCEGKGDLRQKCEEKGDLRQKCEKKVNFEPWVKDIKEVVWDNKIGNMCVWDGI